MAPSYFNLFLGKLECKILEIQNRIPQLWWRYVHAIFAIWSRGEPGLHTFNVNLNCHHPTIYFTAFSSTKETIFLDMRVYPQTNIKLIGMDNNHKKHCKTVIAYSQTSTSNEPAWRTKFSKKRLWS